MRISNRGGRGVLPIFLLLMILGIPLFAGGNGESEDGYDPKNELEKAANLNVEREKEIRKQVLEEAAERVDKTARKAGVTPEALELIHKALGI